MLNGIDQTNEALSLAGGPKGRTATLSGKNPQLRFLSTTACPTVACHLLLFIDRAMEQAGIRSLSNRQGQAEAFVAKVFSKLRLMRNVRRSSAGPVFVSFMGFSESKTWPFSYWTEIVPYCFDCWPNLYKRWTSFFKRHRVRIAFFSARQSAQHFADALPNMKSVWLPEATEPFEYYPSKSWPERDIDVLELGRKNDRFHSRIVEPLAKIGKIHLFERVKGEIIFPDRTSLIDGLGRSKVSICFPCSQTHPERSGSVETVTLRYFESMASKCLIVGHAPQELIDLFGYNPVIEAQSGYEFEQMESLLNNLGSFQSLVERNYRRLVEIGTWKNRVATILDILREFPS
jgi:hypothetical protein